MKAAATRSWLLALAASALLYGGKYNAVGEVGMRAPAFRNLVGTDDKSYSLADAAEDVVVLVFLANHYPWVQGGDNDLIRLTGELKGKSTRTPEFFVLNKQAKIVYTGLLHNSSVQMRPDGTLHYTIGPPSAHYVRDAVNAALAGKPVAVPETRAQGCTVEYTQK